MSISLEVEDISSHLLIAKEVFKLLLVISRQLWNDYFVLVEKSYKIRGFLVLEETVGLGCLLSPETYVIVWIEVVVIGLGHS